MPVIHIDQNCRDRLAWKLRRTAGRGDTEAFPLPPPEELLTCLRCELGCSTSYVTEYVLPDVSGKLDSASQRWLQSSAEFQKAEGIRRFGAIA